ncbi:hypothetical protein Bca52824_096178 [Brassica carinata]|uniref:Uncharacterized protein n=1 Tax=Brassica carinata TaxID=52824 RepID=A0A8X7THK3_BRACI|nr:hypothetical protein Bca52824_096178 [Brassica carinata]
MKGEQLRALPRMFSLIKSESWGLEGDRIVLVSTISDADQGSADVAFRTRWHLMKSKFLGSGVWCARLKLKGIVEGHHRWSLRQFDSTGKLTRSDIVRIDRRELFLDSMGGAWRS